ncbi:MAG: amidohydrolase [Gemmatimonadetes bacterium]|nr:MAG: amidohydrolase [Gemmatimonadota bacterium]
MIPSTPFFRTARRLLAGAALACAFVRPIALDAQVREPADLVLLNGNVYTADAAHPRAQAVAVREGRIVLVGSTREARALVGEGTEVIDLEGRTLIPGMMDSHGHLPGLGSALRIVDLVGTRSYDEVIERVRARAAEVPAGQWIRGRGWDQNEWGDTRFPHHAALSEAVPDHPVVLTRVDGHAIFVNARAMELAGITDDTPDPEGGRIVRDPDTGEAIGVFVDRAMGLVNRVVPAESRDEVHEGILLAQRELNRYGLTAMADAGVGRDVIDLYEEMAERGEWTIRNYVMVRPADLDHYFALGPRDNIGGDHMLSVRSIKVSVDGALGSRGAALLEDYSDEPGNRGLVMVPPERLLPIARAALQHGFQLNVHAIGDRGNRLVLDVFEQALAENPVADHRFRIEHAQILHRHDLPRFAELGVIPSMQAIHQASDMYWAENRLGWTRLQGAYAWQSLLQSGVIIPGGSDFPVESPDPLLSFHAAVSRQDAHNWPTGGWFPEQRMTREQALYHLTIWGAQAAFMEDRIGSITPGKLADLVVLSQDIMVVPAEEILDTKVEMTFVGGRLVYDRAAEGERPRTDG